MGSTNKKKNPVADKNFYLPVKKTFEYPSPPIHTLFNQVFSKNT